MSEPKFQYSANSGRFGRPPKFGSTLLMFDSLLMQKFRDTFNHLKSLKYSTPNVFVTKNLCRVI